MRRARGLFPELFAVHQVPYTDIGSLARGPDDRGQLYIDYCHLTPEGARAAAELMLPVVLDKVFERLAPRPDGPAAAGPA